ncbi:ESPR-type extended signal peptide-containing protein, partial [Pandoraea terrae]
MNARCYRLVFNPVRSQWLAVAEFVTSGQSPGLSRSGRRASGGGTSGQRAGGQRSLGRAAALWATAAMLVLPHMAIAQIVPDTGAGPSSPGVHAAPNGVPLVDITAPTPGGV